MGTLKPGATYVYERNGEEIYAREEGQLDRTLIGYQYENKIDPRTDDGRPLHEHMREDQLWRDIRRTAKHAPALHDALERVKVMYYLVEDHKNTYGNRSKT